MATLEEIIEMNCPMQNIVCWSREIIVRRLRELHAYFVYARALNPIPLKRLVCDYLETDIDVILQKICDLEAEVCNDAIVTPELECFIIEYLNEVTVNPPFDEQAVRIGAPNFFYDTWRSRTPKI